MSLHATSLLAGLFSVAMVLLSVQISVRRFKTGIAAGDGGEDRTLRRRVRAHGNFIEYAPTALLATGLVEYAAGTTAFVWGLAGVFFLSRLVHALGMLYASSPAARAVAMLVQHAAFLAAGLWLIARAM